eukprot:TRINITY_DN107372_c0_g1_i1.p1 TRINITY_DN107372_c0_g1~~TRINITY_DN107372_c0_g1_i1.p1  ORF type:complete len:357 (+),score=107.56 TRINITY_DN107372_c0_g1_i1:109-1179(+)
MGRIDKQEHSDKSRWFIKGKSLDDQVKACRKSLEAAERSGRENIARALQEKLNKLLQSAGSVQHGTTAGKQAKSEAAPGGSKGKQENQVVKAKKAKLKRKSCVLLEAAAVPAPEVPQQVLKKKRKVKIKKATSGPAGADKSIANTAKAASKKKRKPATEDISRQAAIDLLLRASAKARASRLAHGEESEEEAVPPELPPPRSDLGGETGGQSESDVMPDFGEEGEEEGEEERHEGDEEEEPVTDVTDLESAREEKKEKKKAEDGDEDSFFDSADEDMAVVEVEDASAQESAGSKPGRSALRRAKKLRRKERLQSIRDSAKKTHPSWLAAKTPRVSGAMPKRPKGGTRMTFDSESGE